MLFSARETFPLCSRHDDERWKTEMPAPSLAIWTVCHVGPLPPTTTVPGYVRTAWTLPIVVAVVNDGDADGRERMRADRCWMGHGECQRRPSQLRAVIHCRVLLIDLGICILAQSDKITGTANTSAWPYLPQAFGHLQG